MQEPSYWLSASVLTMTSAPARNGVEAGEARSQAHGSPRDVVHAVLLRPRRSVLAASSMTSHSTTSNRSAVGGVSGSVASSLTGIWMTSFKPATSCNRASVGSSVTTVPHDPAPGDLRQRRRASAPAGAGRPPVNRRAPHAATNRPRRFSPRGPQQGAFGVALLHRDPGRGDRRPAGPRPSAHRGHGDPTSSCRPDRPTQRAGCSAGDGLRGWRRRRGAKTRSD